ncbi:MAG TPA: NAD-dependent epimerase/dehydratase family protein [Jatrophihabitantaceae bacterium]|jgi:UDP-glucose 4-epimerase|nr:NAD-dependent epimerase/dehydratase family protein [Jatrophihabitantaceae bacterium]
MPRVVLVTGVSRHLGVRLAAQLAADPSIERVLGVDTTPPSKADLARLGRTEFVRADIRNPLIARVIAHANVDSVVHAAVTATPRRAGGRTAMKELNVIGTMQLLAASQKSETVQRLVVKSATSVYGSSPRDPAVFAEDTPTRAAPSSGYGKDAVEVEGFVRAFGRRRPDVHVTVLRLANVIGPTIDTPLTRYFALPVVPTEFGYDPRLQFVHEDDAVEVLRLATVEEHTGVFNVSGEGTLLLSQAIRRAGRVALPVPAPAVRAVVSLVRRSGMVDFSPEQVRFLSHGRVVDTSRLRTQFGYQPRYSTAAAFEAFLAGRPLPPVVSPERIHQAERLAAKLLGAREPMADHG